MSPLSAGQMDIKGPRGMHVPEKLWTVCNFPEEDHATAECPAFGTDVCSASLRRWSLRTPRRPFPLVSEGVVQLARTNTTSERQRQA